MSAPVEYTPEQCLAPSELPGYPKPGFCRSCLAAVVWGVTTTGRAAPFDAEPPHPNHFITCPQASSHRKAGASRKRKASAHE